MGKNSRTTNTLLNLLSSFGGRMVRTVLTFVVRTIFIYTLGKTYLGVNGVYTSALNMLSLAELGFGATIVFHLYKPLATKDEHRVRLLLKLYKTVYRIIGIVILIIGICMIPLLPIIIKDYDNLSLLGIDATLIFILYLLQSASSYLFYAYRQTVVEADQKKYILDLTECGRTLFESILQIISLIIYKSFLAYTISTLISTILFNFINGYLARRIYPCFFSKEPESLSKKDIIGLFKDCGAMFLYRIESVVLKATDNMVLSAFIGLDIAGVYSSYVLIINACKGFLEKFYVSVKHSMGNLYATESFEKRFQYFEIMNFLTAVLYGTTSIGLIVCCDDLIYVWAGSDYVIARPFCFLIGAEVYFDGLIRNLTQIRNISGAFRQLWYRPVVAIAVNLVSSIALVNSIGINGVIIGTIFAQLFVGLIVDPMVVMNVCFNKYKSIGYYYIKNLLYVIVLVLGCCITLLISRFILPSLSWTSVIVHALIVAVLIPLLFVGIYYKSMECQYLLGVIKRIVRKVFRYK